MTNALLSYYPVAVSDQLCHPTLKLWTTNPYYPTTKFFMTSCWCCRVCFSLKLHCQSLSHWSNLPRAGGIECNPGPNLPRFPCGECRKACTDNEGARATILCEECNSWFHADCVNIKEMFSSLSRSDISWECTNCGLKMSQPAYLIQSHLTV